MAFAGADVVRVVGIPLRIIGASHGNLNYLVNLALALKQYGQTWQPVVLTDTSCLPANSKVQLDNGSVIIADIASFSVRQSAFSFARALVHADMDARAAAKKLHLDAIFENAAYYGRCEMPALHWIPDLQHRELPHMFTTFTRLRREVLIRSVLASNRQILLSSNTSRSALIEHFSVNATRLHVARFASLLVQQSIAHATNVSEQLGIQEPFAFVPNQFWRHKNHMILPRAAKLLAERGIAIKFVCTGEQRDPRNPAYFTQFENEVAKCGVRDRFILPGLVPYSVVRSLHEQCEMLVNPSYVEGWNTGVEEAKCVGSPLVLSSIGTHREQAIGYPRVSLFDPDSAVQLADTIAESLASGPVTAAIRSASAAMYPKNVRNFVADVERALDVTTHARRDR
jgi:glycosyltransferase involved in cell wall biosynthesis